MWTGYEFDLADQMPGSITDTLSPIVLRESPQ
jgi:hypothetical protein